MNQRPRKKITKEMTIKEVLEVCPEAAEILHKYLGHCITCPSAHLETLALGAHFHEKDVKEIVDEINEACSKISKKRK